MSESRNIFSGDEEPDLEIRFFVRGQAEEAKALFVNQDTVTHYSDHLKKRLQKTDKLDVEDFPSTDSALVEVMQNLHNLDSGKTTKDDLIAGLKIDTIIEVYLCVAFFEFIKQRFNYCRVCEEKLQDWLSDLSTGLQTAVQLLYQARHFQKVTELAHFKLIDLCGARLHVQVEGNPEQNYMHWSPELMELPCNIALRILQGANEVKISSETTAPSAEETVQKYLPCAAIQQWANLYVRGADIEQFKDNELVRELLKLTNDDCCLDTALIVQITGKACMSEELAALASRPECAPLMFEQINAALRTALGVCSPIGELRIPSATRCDWFKTYSALQGVAGGTVFSQLIRSFARHVSPARVYALAQLIVALYGLSPSVSQNDIVDPAQWAHDILSSALEANQWRVPTVEAAVAEAFAHVCSRLTGDRRRRQWCAQCVQPESAHATPSTPPQESYARLDRLCGLDPGTTLRRAQTRELAQHSALAHLSSSGTIMNLGSAGTRIVTPAHATLSEVQYVVIVQAQQLGLHGFNARTGGIDATPNCQITFDSPINQAHCLSSHRIVTVHGDGSLRAAQYTPGSNEALDSHTLTFSTLTQCFVFPSLGCALVQGATAQGSQYSGWYSVNCTNVTAVELHVIPQSITSATALLATDRHLIACGTDTAHVIDPNTLTTTREIPIGAHTHRTFVEPNYLLLAQDGQLWAYDISAQKDNRCICLPSPPTSLAASSCDGHVLVTTDTSLYNVCCHTGEVRVVSVWGQGAVGVITPQSVLQLHQGLSLFLRNSQIVTSGSARVCYLTEQQLMRNNPPLSEKGENVSQRSSMASSTPSTTCVPQTDDAVLQTPAQEGLPVDDDDW